MPAAALCCFRTGKASIIGQRFQEPPTIHILHSTVGLLLIAALTALAARRIHLPYTVGLTVVGLGMAWLHADVGLTLTHTLIFEVLLPPLLFEGALSLPWRALKQDAWPIGLLATGGVGIAVAVIAAGMTWGAGWPWQAALILGALLAATDPVSVLALFKEARIEGRLRHIMEAESLLNDGVAAVVFSLVVATAAVPHAGAGPLGPTLGAIAWMAVGGVFVGAGVAGAAIVLAGRTMDPLVETTLTTVAAYGSFALAEMGHTSGVLAAVTAGLVMGNAGMMRQEGHGTISSRGREVVAAFWEFAAFVANSLVFLLIGVRLAQIPFATLGMGALTLVVALTLLGRALSVYGLCGVFARSRLRIKAGHQHALFWGGLRGALALALALSLPPDLPRRDAIVIASFGVVAFSVMVQGITMPLLLRRLGLTPQFTKEQET